MPKSAPAAGDAKDDAANATMMMPGAEVLLKALEDEGVEVVFGYPGGAVLPIYDALFKNNKIRHILVRHEQAAVHAAVAGVTPVGNSAQAAVSSQRPTSPATSRLSIS